MADKKISQLPNGTLTPSTIFPILSNGTTSKVTFSKMLSQIITSDTFLTGATYNQVSGTTTFYFNNDTSFNVSGYFTGLTFSAENITNKQNSMVFDATNIKYPTVTAVNQLANDIALATINTGFIDPNDTFILTRLDNFTLAISASSKGVIFKSLLEIPPFAPSSAILNIHDAIIPLSAISFTGDGIYVRFLGFSDDNNIVVSEATFKGSLSTAQLGVLILNVSGGTTSFLDSTRGIINIPSIAGYSNLELSMLELQSDITIRPNSGTTTVNNTAGSLKGMSVNWHGANNDIRPISSSTITSFTHLSQANALVPIVPTFMTAVTTNQYWNGSSLVNISTIGAASIQRWLVTINGTIALQYGEREYVNLDTAKENISIASFLDVIPRDTYVEIARMAAISGATNLSDTNQVVFRTTAGGGSGGETNVTVWGTINGNINDQTDLINKINTTNLFSASTGLNSIVNKYTNNIASGVFSFAYGSGTTATGSYSHAEGQDTQAIGIATHAEGENTQAIGEASHAEGYLTVTNGQVCHAEGWDTIANGDASHAQGYQTQALDFAAHAEGGGTIADDYYAHAEGEDTRAIGRTCHAEGKETTAITNTTGFGWGCHAEGYQTFAWGDFGVYGAHAEGQLTRASGNCSHAEGYTTQAYGHYSHAEGYLTRATNFQSHAEGFQCFATGDSSHAEGNFTKAYGASSHSEGATTIASGFGSHAEGVLTIASGRSAHAEGSGTTAGGTGSHAEGTGTTANGFASHAEGANTIASGDRSHAEGYLTRASGFSSHAEGGATSATSQYTHSEGFTTKATGDYAHAEGYFTQATGFYSHAEGFQSIASSGPSHAEGQTTIASGSASHAEGAQTVAGGNYCHAEGQQTTANGSTCHAEGQGTQANGTICHAEGINTIANGLFTHAEGNGSIASGQSSHAEGELTIAGGFGSHAEGFNTRAMGSNSHAGGFNSSATTSANYAFVYGSGSTVSGQHSVVLGSGLLGTGTNRTYINLLNIKNVPTGTSVNNLGINNLGDVVIGSSNSYSDTGLSTSAITINFTTNNIQKLTLIGNTDIIFTGMIAGYPYRLITSITAETFNSAITFPSTYIFDKGNNPYSFSVLPTIDSVFTSTTDASILSMTVQSGDSKILLGGGFVLYSGVSKNKIVRLNPDGTIDTNFVIGTGFGALANENVSSMVVQPDGKIICGGSFVTYSGVSKNKIVRLNSGGTIDSTFNMGTGFSGSFGGNVNALALQLDGKIIVGGGFSAYNGTVINRLIRLNPDGTYDNTFTIGAAGFNDTVTALAIQSDGKIIVGGAFSTFSGISKNCVARLNSNGSNDTTFANGSPSLPGSDNTNSIVIQPNGKIIFGNYSGISQFIFRLQANGTLDASFSTGTNFDNTVNKLLLLPNGKVLVAGFFANYNGTPAAGVARLHSDGSFDSTFKMGNGFTSYPNTIVQQPDNKILFAGSMTAFSGVSTSRLIRLNNVDYPKVNIIDIVTDGTNIILK